MWDMFTPILFSCLEPKAGEFLFCNGVHFVILVYNFSFGTEMFSYIFDSPVLHVICWLDTRFLFRNNSISITLMRIFSLSELVSNPSVRHIRSHRHRNSTASNTLKQKETNWYRRKRHELLYWLRLSCYFHYVRS